MIKRYINFLVQFQYTKKSFLYKVISIICGIVFFLAVLPAFFIWVGRFVDSYYSLTSSIVSMTLIAIVAILIGLFFMFWSTYTQLTIGKGAPTPNVPTKNLIISGPYRICRNPIELGAIIYYFGLGTITQYSYTIGIVCLLLGLLLGSIYHKFFEEKELEERFGGDYIKYKSEVPFLIPDFWKYLRK